MQNEAFYAEEQEESLQVEELEFAPAALDDSLPEVEDPLQEINLGTKDDPKPTFISVLLDEPLKGEIIAPLHDFRDCFAWHYHEMPGLEAFLRMRQHKLKMNPKKCIFGVQAGNFLSFLVHRRGIDSEE
ncbi:unnamed protein product [Prunus armeniaca]